LFDSGGDALRGSLLSSGDRINTDEGAMITAICKILGVFVGRRRVATTTMTTPPISAPSVVARLS
jgi:hypothetical protein